MTGELQKNVYQKNYLLNGFKLKILENKKVLEESQIGWAQILVPSLPSRNKFLVIAVKNYTISDCKILCSCPFFLDFFTYFQIFCPSLQMFTIPWKKRTIGSSFKTRIVSVVHKKGHYILKSHAKNSKFNNLP